MSDEDPGELASESEGLCSARPGEILRPGNRAHGKICDSAQDRFASEKLALHEKNTDTDIF